MFKRITDFLEADFKKPLMKSRVLIGIVIIWLLITIFLMILISKSLSGLAPCPNTFSPKCLSNFSENMEFPFKLTTIFFALASFWALVFRSHQTTEQIKISQKQTQLTTNNNTFNNYIAHKKAFIDLLESFEEEQSCIIAGKQLLYKKLFPENKPIKMFFECENKCIEEMLFLAEENIQNFFNKLKKRQNLEDDLFAFETYASSLKSSNSIEFTDTVCFDSSSNKINLPSDLYASLEITKDLCRTILEFSDPISPVNIKGFNPGYKRNKNTKYPIDLHDRLYAINAELYDLNSGISIR